MPLSAGSGLAQSMVGGIYGCRHGGNKRLSAALPKTGETIRAGLKWLAEHQNEDGSWDAATFMRHDKPGAKPTSGIGKDLSPISATGLALLPFLGEGSIPSHGPHSEILDRALQWLRAQQEDDGTFRGCLPRNAVREHALATYALTELAGLGRDRGPAVIARKALEALASMKNKAGLWGRSAEGQQTDPLATLWAVFAIRSASHLRIGKPTSIDKLRARLVKGLDSNCRLPNPTKGGAPAASPAANFAATVFARVFLGEDARSSDRLRDSLLELKKIKPAKDYADADPLLCLFGSCATYQAGGEAWTQWMGAVRPQLVAAQRTDGNHRGSWDPVGPNAAAGGRICATALAILSLQTYYRYTKFHR